MKPGLRGEFFFAVLPRGATSVQLVARGDSEDRVLSAGFSFLEGLPRKEAGRYFFGSCEQNASQREVLEMACEHLRIVPPPSWAS